MRSEEISPDYLLTPQDRCDACQAQAYFQVQFESGELFFCLHHWLVNKDSMVDIALDVVDESERLLAK